MSRIFMDGFESGDTGLWNTVSGASVNTLAGKDGNYCVSIPSTTTYMIKQISSTSELYVSLKYYCGDFTGKAIITFLSPLLTVNGPCDPISNRCAEWPEIQIHLNVQWLDTARLSLQLHQGTAAYLTPSRRNTGIGDRKWIVSGPIRLEVRRALATKNSYYPRSNNKMKIPR